MSGVDRVEDLDIYKLAVKLRREVIRCTSSGPVVRDSRFVTQIRDAARGGPRTISEGFYRIAPLEFRNFLRYAKSTLEETKTHVSDGFECGYFNAPDTDRMLILARRTLGGVTRLMTYLESPAAARSYEAVRARQHNAAKSARGQTSQRPRVRERLQDEPENPERRTVNREP
jgi:four helix bundle protein